MSDAPGGDILKERARGEATVIVDRVTKKYPRRSLLGWLTGRGDGEKTDALREISFTAREGETVGVLGPNGAGKTTLLKIIATMLHPTSGRVLIDGRETTSDPVGARQRMGLVTSDERSFYWRLTGRQNLQFFATLLGMPRDEASRIDRLLETLGLEGAADRPFHDYSSGMKQRMAIARGLLADPRIVLYDEPTRALDPLSARTIRGWIKDRPRQTPETTHLIATNQLDEAEELCDRVIIIDQGSIIASGSIEEIRSRFQDHLVHQIVCRDLRHLERFQRDPGIGILDVDFETSGAVTTLRLQTAKDSAALSYVLARIVSQGATVVSCNTRMAPFDQVYCSLVERESNRVPEPVETEAG